MAIASEFSAPALTIEDDKIRASERAASTAVTVAHEAAVAGMVLLLYRDGTFVKRVTIAEGETSTATTLSGAGWGADGVHIFTALLAMAADETDVSPPSAGFSVLVDSLAPERPTMWSVAGDDKVNAAELAAGATFDVDHEAAEAGAKLRIFRDGTLVKTVDLDAAATRSTVTLEAQELGADGSYLYTVQMVDAAGNEGAISRARTVTVAAQLPDAVVVETYALDDKVNAKEAASSTRVVVSHQEAMANSLLELRRDGEVVKTFTLRKGATSTTMTLLAADWGAEGEHEFEVRMVDGAGNAGAWSEARTVLVDKTAPNALSVVSIAEDGQVGAAEWAAGSVVSLSHDAAPDGAQIEVYLNGRFLRFVAVEAGETATAFNLTSADWQADGIHRFKARLVDSAGNAGVWTDEVRVTVDTQGPPAPIVAVISGNDAVNAAEKAANTALSIRHEAAKLGAKLEIYRDGALLHTVQLADRATSTSVNLTGNDWGDDGVRVFTVRMVDSAGNVGEFSAARDVIVDAGVPEKVTLSAISTDNRINALEKAAQTAITITHEEAAAGSRLEIQRDGGTIAFVDVAEGAESTSISLTGVQWGMDGARAFKVRMIDGAGNVGQWSDVASVLVDTRAPTAVTLSAISGNDGVNASEREGNIEVAIRHEAASEGSYLELYRNDQFWKSLAVATGSVSNAITLVAEDWGVDGNYEVKARLVDGAGNEGAWSRPRTVSVDSIAPDAVTLSSVAGDNKVNAAEKFATSVLTVTHEAASIGSVLKVFRDGVLLKTISPVSGATTTDISLRGTDWGQDGERKFTAQLIDGAGNESVLSGERIVLVDSVNLTQMLTDAKNTAGGGVDIDVLNIMLMDYWGPAGSEEASQPDMGRYAIDVALKALEILDSVGYTDTKLGLYVKPGINQYGQTFTLQDAAQLYEFAKDNPDIAYVGLNSLAKDRQGTLGEATQQGSGLTQTDWQFSGIFGNV
ncbi:hypothetical protein FPY71_03865 [Aureimonas fodinaquatilis]|uniref:Uncharacterized protein n=1 Tax=Aureimonas fodinaquatilis TaxID=2565783 RepID=A0A5B0E2S7_9HYPH|nr:hypothetical protein [Aureimonas fodinaquatilis]KAA0972251.1 hypothetical protein FPY71_03865 [Aureimonas fodinaquatilis]